MGYELLEYKLKDAANIKKWNEIKNDREKYIKEYLKKHSTMNSVLSKLRQLFKVTPVALKENKSENAQKYRKLALYLLAHFSKEDEQIICNEFNITLKEFMDIKNDSSIEQEYYDQINQFINHESHKGIITNTYANLAFGEQAIRVIDKLGKSFQTRIRT